MPGFAIISRLRRALRFVWKSGPDWTIASLVLHFLQGLLPLAALYLMKLIVDAVSAGFSAENKALAFNQVLWYIFLAGIVALTGALLRQVAAVVSEAHSLKVTDFMQDIIHGKSEEVDIEYYENSRYFDTLHRAQIEATSRPGKILEGFIRIFQNLISLIGVIGLLATLNWSMAIIIFIAALPGVIVRVNFAKKLFHLQWQWTPNERKAEYYRWMLTDFTHAKEHRLYNIGKLLIDRYRILRKELRNDRIGYAKRRAAAQFFTESGATIVVFAALGFVAYRAVYGIITLGDMVMFYGAFQQGLGYIRNTLLGIAGLYEDDLFLKNLFGFLDLEKKVVEPANPKPVPKSMERGIVFENVSFKYPTGTRPVLNDVNLRIEPGQIVALVGDNGAGKTTLVKLLCRLYDPDEGIITIDGINLKDFNTQELRSQISVIFQDYVKFQMTARENIWFGNIELPPDIEKIRIAAAKADADKVIESLPQQYETILGKWFAEGEELSVGEWQKIALARAFMRNSQIVVLDEPTSSMDAKSEYEIFQGFKKIISNQSAVIISHRFSTVRMADYIYVLENGTIAEYGSHERLLEMNGKYAKLFEMQAQSYR